MMREKPVKAAANLSKWLKSLVAEPFIGTVPPELVQCEYECRVPQCSFQKWQSCENRIRRMSEEIAFAQQELNQGPAVCQKR